MRNHLRAAIAAIFMAVTVTAYSAQDPGCGPIGAMGLPIRPGLTCAVSRDLKHLLGKEIFLDGYGWLFVNDTMHERWAKRVDVCVDSADDAERHGVKKARIDGVSK